VEEFSARDTEVSEWNVRGLADWVNLTFPLGMPEAEIVKAANSGKDDPERVCLPNGAVRVNPLPYKIVQRPETIALLWEGNTHSYRRFFLDGRAHTLDIEPESWTGQSIGKWDNDTLVVDTVGFNDKAWFDRRGTPHSEQLHIVERYTRPNYGTLVNDVVLEDPGALAHPVKLQFKARLMRPDKQTGTGDLMEFICNEDNQYGSAGGFRPGTGAGNGTNINNR